VTRCAVHTEPAAASRSPLWDQLLPIHVLPDDELVVIIKAMIPEEDVIGEGRLAGAVLLDRVGPSFFLKLLSLQGRPAGRIEVSATLQGPDAATAPPSPPPLFPEAQKSTRGATRMVSFNSPPSFTTSKVAPTAEFPTFAPRRSNLLSDPPPTFVRRDPSDDFPTFTAAKVEASRDPAPTVVPRPRASEEFPTFVPK
jgi:hypothetical protein